MEESVWIYISIIAVIIALVIIISLFTQNKEHMKEQAFSNAFLEIEPHCNYVCGSPPGSIIPLEVNIPSGIVIYTKDQKICGQYKDKTACAVCACKVASYTLDLNTTQAKETFDVHAFNCYFERGENEVKMECQG
ncbi:hypothetical protein KY348_01740 [Candidatus Woesearchaeota archaeon]|nr:hypothetical protein [Candidatus Woesearchaeota archaeon]